MVNATYRRRSAGEILRDDLGRDRTRNTKKTAEDTSSHPNFTHFHRNIMTIHDMSCSTKPRVTSISISKSETSPQLMPPSMACTKVYAFAGAMWLHVTWEFWNQQEFCPSFYSLMMLLSFAFYVFLFSLGCGLRKCHGCSMCSHMLRTTLSWPKIQSACASAPALDLRLLQPT